MPLAGNCSSVST